MPKPGFPVVVALLAGLLLPAAIAPLCAAGPAPMGCCKSASPCAPGLGTGAACCRADASPSTREAPAVQRSQDPSGRGSDGLTADLEGPAALPAPESQAFGALSEIARAHHPPVPLYLLNATILR